MTIQEMPTRPTPATIPMVLDIETIRSRVADIKAEWSPEEAQARAIEGARRRAELQNLMLELLCDVSDSEESCDLVEHGFSLVG
ncbi:MAG: hypothetical protein AAF483_28535 [Planctomycetota bacterium]